MVKCSPLDSNQKLKFCKIKGDRVLTQGRSFGKSGGYSSKKFGEKRTTRFSQKVKKSDSGNIPTFRREVAKVTKIHKFTVSLSSKQKAILKSMAHHLKPVVLIGIQGITDGVVQELELALSKHELIKVQLPGQNDATEKNQDMLDLLSAISLKHVHFIARMGRILVLYMEKNPEEAKIVLSKLSKYVEE